MVLSARLRIAFALFYLILISILFCLPGSALPKIDWSSKIHFDKWVHIGFFTVLAMLWLWASKLFQKRIPVLMLAAALYGLAVEVVQDRFIANRSFDAGDWLADMAGAALGVWLWKGYIKNRPL